MTAMHPLYSVADIRQIEAAAQAQLPPATLMQRAGAAAAQYALTLIAEPRSEARVLILAGPGNNGGDALEAAHHLAHAGLMVSIVLHADPDRQSDDARQALRRAQGSPATFAPWSDELARGSWSLVIDGLFGIGLARPIAGPMRQIIEAVNTLGCPILALDLPSGLDADSGDIVGPDGIAIHASATITFIADKPGLHTCYGRDCAGKVHVEPLGVATGLYPRPQTMLNDAALFRRAVHPRAHNSHKGSYGNIAVIGGAQGMGGAVILTARAALFCGAGRVFAGFLDAAPAYDAGQPELMCRPADEIDFTGATLVAGPGLGMSNQAAMLLAQVLNAPSPIVLDADALNLIAAEAGLQHKLAARKAPAVMTPHPLEAARMLALSATQIQADRLTAARELARRYQAVVVLKGSGTVIARPDGLAAVNPTGNPALASGGTGDVLAGACGALLAQGLPAWEAALAAVWLHGGAADDLVEQGNGPIGLAASELPPAIRRALNRLVN